MNTCRLRWICFTAIILLSLLVSMSGSPLPAQAGASRAAGDVPAGDVTIIDGDQIQLPPYYLYLPCVFKNPCIPIFFDDFSNPASGWPVSISDPVQWAYSSGEYLIRIDPTPDGYWGAAYPGVQAANYRAAVSVHFSPFYPAEDDPYFGLIFGIYADWSKFYTFEILPDGWWGLWLYDEALGSDPWKLLDEGYSVYIYQGILTNRLMIERNGTTIKAYANGQLLTTTYDATITGARYIGVIAENYYDTQVSFYFDDFGVYPVDCPLSDIFSASFSSIGASTLLDFEGSEMISGHFSSASRKADQ